MDADVIVVGAGLAGLVAAAEAAEAGRRVLLLDQEPEQSLGGQAWWSFGGLFFVDSPEQRRLRVHDSVDLAWRDWLGTAGFDRPEDEWPRKWARAYVEWAAGEKRAWLASMGHSVVPVVGWAERGGYHASGVGNSVPRFHVTWGTGPGVVGPFERRVRAAAETGRLQFRFRHRVDALTVTDGTVDGVSGTILENSDVPRGAPSSRTRAGEFEFGAQAVIITSGGIGGNHDLVRQTGGPSGSVRRPTHAVGVPAHVDGRMIGIAERAGGAVINRDRMWHYVEGIANWNPVWPMHGIRILPGPSSLWLDATGQAAAAAAVPGLRHARHARATCAAPATTTPGSSCQASHHRAGVRPVRLRAEPRSHRPRPEGDAGEPVRRRRAGPGAGVPRQGRGLRHRRRTWPAWSRR